MHPIPLDVRAVLEKRPEMHRCIYCKIKAEREKCCDMYGRRNGRVEWEHAFIYSGKQIQEWWAIIGVCYYHHRGDGQNKDFNKWCALKRVTAKQFAELKEKYPRFNWDWEYKRLQKKYA